MNRKIIIFIFLWIVLSASATVAASEELSLTNEQYIADYDYLVQVLTEHYPHVTTLQRMGIDMEAILSEGRSQLLNLLANGGDELDYYNFIYDICSEMNFFAHLHPYSSQEYYKIMEAAISVGDLTCPWNDEIAWLDSQTTHFYDLISEMSGMYRQKTSSPPLPVTLLFPEQKVGYIRFSNFLCFPGEGEYAEHRRVIEQFYKDTKYYNHIIFDITDNTGGSTQYWQELIIEPLGGQYQFNEYFLYRAIPDYLSTEPWPQNLLTIDELPSEICIQHDEDRSSLKYYHVQTYSFDYGTPIEHQAQRWVLIDSPTFSAGDSMASFCKHTGWATLVGNCTGGDGIHSGDTPYFPLPNSGLLMKFTPYYTLNLDGSCNAEEGTEPDIFSFNRSPLLTCLNEIQAAGTNINGIISNDRIKLFY